MRGRAARVLGVCGGLQMLGEALIDTVGVDGNAPGLGLLPLVTVFEPAKTVRRTSASLRAARRRLGGALGRGCAATKSTTARPPSTPPWPPGAMWRASVMPGIGLAEPGGQCAGLYLHGFFEDAAVLHALFGAEAPTLDAGVRRPGRWAWPGTSTWACWTR